MYSGEKYPDFMSGSLYVMPMGWESLHFWQKKANHGPLTFASESSPACTLPVSASPSSTSTTSSSPGSQLRRAGSGGSGTRGSTPVFFVLFSFFREMTIFCRLGGGQGLPPWPGFRPLLDSDEQGSPPPHRVSAGGGHRSERGQQVLPAAEQQPGLVRREGGVLKGC